MGVALPRLQPFYDGTPKSIQVQSVLYRNDKDAVYRALQSLYRAADLAIASGWCHKVTVCYGDGSDAPCLADQDVADLKNEFQDAIELRYKFFGENRGSARGHNTLAADANSDFLLILNPDVVVSPTLLSEMMREFSHRGTGMVEAKQLPIEHPKDYDPRTGETAWATTACALIPLSLFRQLGGFDANSFFLYCDDVDFSWLVREAGYKVIFQPAAVVFHDKRLSASGNWLPSSAERYYSAEAALFMTYKWSRHELLEFYLQTFLGSSNPDQEKAARAFLEKRAAGLLPKPRDPDNRIGQFVDYVYARHRFAL